MARVPKISRYFTVKHNLTFHANCLKRGINLPIYLLVNLSDTPVHNAVRRSSCKGFIQIKIFFFDEYLIESVISVPLAL